MVLLWIECIAREEFFDIYVTNLTLNIYLC